MGIIALIIATILAVIEATRSGYKHIGIALAVVNGILLLVVPLVALIGAVFVGMALAAAVFAGTRSRRLQRIAEGDDSLDLAAHVPINRKQLDAGNPYAGTE